MCLSTFLLAMHLHTALPTQGRAGGREVDKAIALGSRMHTALALSPPAPRRVKTAPLTAGAALDRTSCSWLVVSLKTGTREMIAVLLPGPAGPIFRGSPREQPSQERPRTGKDQTPGSWECSA